MVFLLALVLTGSAHAENTTATWWAHWGGAPYASSVEDACKKAPTAIEGFALPAPVKERFKEVACQGGGEVYLVPGDTLSQSWWGGENPHLEGPIVLPEHPVKIGYDGRPYRKGAVFETAKARVWHVQFEGVQYTLVLPIVCGNWSWYSVPVPSTPTISEKTAAPPVVTQQCPDGFKLTVFLWDLSTINDSSLRKRAEDLMTAADERESESGRRFSAYMPNVPAFSRTLGKELRTTQVPAQIMTQVHIRLLDPKTHVIREDLGALELYAGVGSKTLTFEQSRFVIETLFPSNVRSPAKSRDAGRIVRFYSSEAGGGCSGFVHGAIQAVVGR